MLVTRSCLTFCSPMDYSPPGSSVHEIFQAIILEWVAISSPGGLLDPGIEPICVGGRFFTIWATRESHEPNSIDQLYWIQEILAFLVLSFSQMSNMYLLIRKKHFFEVQTSIIFHIRLHKERCRLTNKRVWKHADTHNDNSLNFYTILFQWGLPCSAGKESALSAGDLGLIPGLGGSPGEGNGNPF